MGLTSPSEFSSLFNTVLLYLTCGGQERTTVKTTVLNNMGIPFLQPFPEQLGIHQAPTLGEDEIEESLYSSIPKGVFCARELLPITTFITTTETFHRCRISCKQKKAKNW